MSESSDRPVGSAAVFRRLLLAGLLVRVLAFICLQPFNNDGPGHFQTLRWIATHHAIPPSDATHEAYQPPLYYLLAAPLYGGRDIGHLRIVQSLSLVFSAVTLFILRALILTPGLFSSRTSQVFSFALVALLPQFVFNSIVISNDSLATLLGAAVALALARAPHLPGWRWVVGLGALAGLGLLTKATFLFYLPVLAGVIGWRYWRRGLIQTGWLVCLFLFIALALGCYKYIRNQIDFGRPTLNNLDYEPLWVNAQRTEYHQWLALHPHQSWNIAPLFWDPVYREDKSSVAPAALLYGTFWFQYIPDGPFRGMIWGASRYFGTAMYAAGLLPTLTAGIGLIVLLGELLRRRTKNEGSGAGAGSDRHRSTRFVLVGLLAINLLMLALVLRHYGVWSVMQARLLFPSIAGGLILLDRGFLVTSRFSWFRRTLIGSFIILFLLIAIFYVLAFRSSIFDSPLGG